MIDAPEFLNKTIMIQLKSKLIGLRKNCSKCEGRGYIIIDPDRGNFKDCDGCIGKITKIEGYLRSNIKEDYIDIGLLDVKSTFTQEVYKRFGDLLDKIIKLSMKFSLAIYRYDDDFSYGTGTAASILLKKLVDEDYQCYSIEFSDFLDTLFNFGDDKERNIVRTRMFDYIQSIPNLMIDNFGSSENDKLIPGSFAYKKASNFLNIRKMHGRFTLISTDLSKQNFKDKFLGSITTLLEQNYLPFEIQCITGKHKHSALSKLGREDSETLSLFTELHPKTVNIEKKKEVVKTEDIPEDTSLDKVMKDREGNGRVKRLSKD